jgi:chemotaxis protein CheD
MQKIEPIELGDIRAGAQPGTVYAVANIGAGVVVTLYDLDRRIGAVACVALPDSKLALESGLVIPGHPPAKYADLAIPRLLEEFIALGGEKRSTMVRMVGGAQLFNFGGGGGNLLNTGVRNATAVRTALSRHGFAVEKADTGGNKGKSLRFILSTGQICVCPHGGTEYVL